MIRMQTKCLLLLIAIHALRSVKSSKDCDNNNICNCSSASDGKLIAKCNANSITFLKDLDFNENAHKVVSLNVSRNRISQLNEDDLKSFTELKRLDLSFNGLRYIDKNSFGSMPKLERLKLSHNGIGHIYAGAFDKLKNLKQIDISNNPLVCDCDLIWLLAWSNKHVVKLQPNPKCEAPADFKGSLLKKLKVGQDLFCESPLQSPILELFPKDDQIIFEGDSLLLRCRSPRIAVGVQHESEDLPARAHIFWGWSEKILEPNSTEDIVYEDPTQVFKDVQLEARHTTDSAILNSVLIIRSASNNHSGQWDCTLRSQQANLSQSIVVRVISENTKYCKPTTIRTNKGVYNWPKLVQGSIAQQLCVEDADPSHMATYRCGNNATWMALNTNDCAYVSETTRILEQFAKVNLTLTKANVLDIAQRLHNFTNTRIYSGKIRDTIDLEFIAKTLLKYLDHVAEQNEIGYLLLNIVSNLMMLPSNIFQAAEHSSNSSKTLLKVAEMSASYVQSSTSLSSKIDNFDETMSKRSATILPVNLYLDYFNIHISTFVGMTCLWFRAEASTYAKRSFECTTANDSFPMFERYIDAALHIPHNIISHPISNNIAQIKLMVGVFRNANLMPYNDVENSTDRRLTSPVIAAKIYEDLAKPALAAVALPENVTIILRMHPYHNVQSSPVPVWLDVEGSFWTESVCHKLYAYRGLLMFTCNRLGYFGIMQHVKYLNHFEYEESGALFRFLPATIYYGCGVVFLSCWINIVTFVTMRRAIKLNRQQRHSFVNMWLAVAALALVFAVGIYQTEWHNRCRTFGLLIHYFSLCVLLWLSVALSGMYKRLSKRQMSTTETPEMLPGAAKDATNRQRKPLLGIYLVGWGIAMLICGISSAVSYSRDYSSYSFCFLHTSSSLNAVLVPSIILLLFLGILFVCVYYHINRKAIDLLHGRNFHQQQQMSEHTQATEHIDLDWLGPLAANHRRINGAGAHSSDDGNNERYKSLTLSNPLSSIVDDYEHTDISNLRAHFIFLCLYLLCWLSAAAFIMDSAIELSTAEHSFDRHSKTEQTIASAPNIDASYAYSLVFAFSCSLMGLFLFLFYICSRNDVKNGLKRNSCCASAQIKLQASAYSATSHADETITASVAHKPAFQTLNADANNAGSRSSSKCSKNRGGGGSVRSIKIDERAQRAAKDGATTVKQLLPANMPSLINNSFNSAAGAAGGGYNSDIPAAEFFYNPNQINVARKFFKKQKRLAKRNNFELQRQIDSVRFDCTENLLSDTTSSTGISNLYSRRHNAMTLLSGGGSKVSNTNLHYRATRHGSYGPISSKDCETMTMAVAQQKQHAKRTMWPNGGTVVERSVSATIANIYTNVPETTAPQHETIKLRTLAARLTPVETLTEQDEESEDNSNDRPPLYENASSINFNDKPLEQTKFELRSATPTKPDVESEAETCCSTVPLFQQTKQTDLLLPNDIEAMNCIGLPDSLSLTLQPSLAPKVPSSSPDIANRYEAAGSKKPLLNDLTESALVSTTITFLSGPRINSNSQQQSKSLENLNDDSKDRIEQLVMTQADCRLRCRSSLSLSQQHLHATLTERAANNLSYERISSNHKNEQATSLNHLPPHSRTLSASPTNYSDLNYQNSEISIRSHGLYAPQTDNDINLTLTDEFPYQSSSEVDDEEFSTFGSCEQNADDDDGNENDETPSPKHDNDHDAINNSIDQLYEAIKRPLLIVQIDNDGKRNANLSAVQAENTSTCDSLELTTDKTDDKDHRQSNASSVFYSSNPDSSNTRDNPNDTLEDDSSQSSVISYIDPNTEKFKKK